MKLDAEPPHEKAPLLVRATLLVCKRCGACGRTKYYLTNAPLSELWDMMRCLKKEQEAAADKAADEEGKPKKEKKEKKKKKDHAYPLLMNKAPTVTDWDFSKESHQLCSKTRKNNKQEGEVYAPLFPPNPEKGWGPKKAASSNRFEKEEAERQSKKPKKAE